MKVRICEVCYFVDGKVTILDDNVRQRTSYRYGYKGRQSTRIDVCPEHRGWGKQFPGKMAFEDAVREMEYGNVGKEAFEAYNYQRPKTDEIKGE
jgi:hypothetical protein